MPPSIPGGKRLMEPCGGSTKSGNYVIFKVSKLRMRRIADE
jgi:hypothetical protein